MEVLSINTNKTTIVSFTKMSRVEPPFVEPTIHVKLAFSDNVKYLDALFDKTLTWNPIWKTSLTRLGYPHGHAEEYTGCGIFSKYRS